MIDALHYNNILTIYILINDIFPVVTCCLRNCNNITADCAMVFKMTKLHTAITVHEQ